jgi:hypothetical protein
MKIASLFMGKPLHEIQIEDPGTNEKTIIFKTVTRYRYRMNPLLENLDSHENRGSDFAYPPDYVRALSYRIHKGIRS